MSALRRLFAIYAGMMNGREFGNMPDYHSMRLCCLLSKRTVAEREVILGPLRSCGRILSLLRALISFSAIGV